jgi:hypothetical protein
VFAALANASLKEQAQYAYRRALADGTITAASRSASLTVAAVPPIEAAPEPPSLVAAISARRNAGASRMPIGAVPEPVFLRGYGPAARPTVARSHEEPPDPPSLTAAVVSRRTR